VTSQKAIAVGGRAAIPSLLTINDQAERYTKGELRDVYVYREDLARHTVREYHPAQ